MIKKRTRPQARTRKISEEVEEIVPKEEEEAEDDEEKLE